MKINRMNYTQIVSKLDKNQSMKKESLKENSKDRISISEESIKLNEYLKSTDNSNVDKIEKIKVEMNQGTYKIDSGKLAEKILDKIRQQDHEE